MTERADACFQDQAVVVTVLPRFAHESCTFVVDSDTTVHDVHTYTSPDQLLCLFPSSDTDAHST